MFQHNNKWPSGRMISILCICSGLVGIGLHALALDVNALPVIESASSPRVPSPTLRNVFVPPNDALPDGSRTRGAASRSPSCLRTNLQTSLQPNLQPNQSEHQDTVAVLPESNYGRTVHERPVFLVYLSNIPEATHSFLFHIRDEQGENVYGTFLPLEQNTKILRVQLPEDAPSLEIGELYKWSVAIPCSGDLKPDTPFVSGWIERIEDATLTEQEFPSDLETVYRYGQAGIWYDMIALLDELHRRQPQNTEAMMVWQNTLHQLGIHETLEILQ